MDTGAGLGRQLDMTGRGHLDPEPWCAANAANAVTEPRTPRPSRGNSADEKLYDTASELSGTHDEN